MKMVWDMPERPAPLRLERDFTIGHLYKAPALDHVLRLCCESGNEGHKILVDICTGEFRNNFTGATSIEYIDVTDEYSVGYVDE